ncbi:class I adenylate-forming enzyme family protein [Nocardia cyriacigeorgica]|uniref:class I adenylate-forming enzyme family protein n=1 Tax=Nocardia cyriacigeorgica TaxID=135487 RepID=UPI002457923E|nr:class I adenylate-forming enzyme family protein [Nocardia cyriacigeorgica]
MSTLPHTVWGQAGTAEALVDGDLRLTYAELRERAERAAGLLVQLGVRPGDRVVLVGHNTVGWVVTYLAGLRLGAIVSPANNRLNPAQFREQCDLLDARVVAHDGAHEALARASERQTYRLEDLAACRQPPLAADHPWPGPDDDAVISFTSGTTGTPKGAVLSHGAILAAARTIADCAGLNSEDSTLVLVPLFHNTGFNDQLGALLAVGGSTHLLGRYRTADALAELRRRPVTYLTAVPSILRLLMVADDAAAAYGPARVVLFGGSPMPAAWSEELLTRWPQLVLLHGYGLTEFTSGCTVLPPDRIITEGESVGLPFPGVTIQVTREDGTPAPAPEGEAGEVWVTGPTRMSRYWAQPELTAAKISGPWLRTGDLGHLDGDGLLWLSGRVDDVINRGGEKVLPAHVESKVSALPAVAEATVFAVPDPVLQERVAVAVILRPTSALDIDAARAHLLTQLPDYAVPEHWTVLDELPRTASGKPDRRAITRTFLERVDSP